MTESVKSKINIMPEGNKGTALNVTKPCYLVNDPSHEVKFIYSNRKQYLFESKMNSIPFPPNLDVTILYLNHNDGLDLIEKYSKDRGWKLDSYTPDYKRLNTVAEYLTLLKMVQQSNAMIIFGSCGKDILKNAFNYGLKVKVFKVGY